MTAPRPSEDLLDWAYMWCGPRVGGGPDWTDHADDLAAQVAAKINEVHARYGALAAELESEADQALTFLREKGNGSINHEKRRMKAWEQKSVAARIAEVAIR